MTIPKIIAEQILHPQIDLLISLSLLVNLPHSLLIIICMFLLLHIQAIFQLLVALVQSSVLL